MHYQQKTSKKRYSALGHDSIIKKKGRPPANATDVQSTKESFARDIGVWQAPKIR